jgi:hypothetical protein
MTRETGIAIRTATNLVMPAKAGIQYGRACGARDSLLADARKLRELFPH